MVAIRDWAQWSTSCRLAVTEPALLSRAASVVDDLLADVDRACSRFRADSELLTLAPDASGWIELSSMLTDLVDVALEAARRTDGAVDPTIGGTLIDLGYDRDIAALQSGSRPTVRVVRRPAGWRSLLLEGSRLRMDPGTQLDLGATAKARAADLCAAAVADELGTGVLVSLGGDIATAGPGPEGGWRILVSDGPGEPECAIALPSGSAVASSSTIRRRWAHDGEQMHHIIDPRTGRPAEPVWRTVTVAATSCVLANTLTTAAVVRGAAARTWLATQGVPARLVAQDGTVSVLGGWPADAADL